MKMYKNKFLFFQTGGEGGAAPVLDPPLGIDIASNVSI